MGRPSKLTPETQEKICEAIRLGATYELACNSAGVSYTSFREWILRGEKAKTGKFLVFSEAIKKAEGDATKKWLSHIEDAAQDGNWQAAAWKLERRYPANYGKQIKQHQQSINVEIDWNDLTDDQITRLANGESLADVLSSD